MKKKTELSCKDLKFFCSPESFSFKTTQDLKPISTGIGQDKGIAALEFGINVDVNGYNLYLEGPSGVGKTMYTRNYLKQISKTKKKPTDWCYIYNFDNPNEPIALNLPAGQGREFRDKMDSFIKDIKKDIKGTFANEDFEKEKNLIIQDFQERRTKLMEDLNVESSKYGFQVKSAQNGIYMMPMIDGKAIEEEEFEKLDDNIKKEYEDKSSIVQEHIIQAIAQIKELDMESEEKLQQWQSNIALLTIDAHSSYVKNNFKRNKKITQFLANIKKDILKNIPNFLTDEKEDKQAQQMSKPEVVKPWLNYRVNLFVDNSHLDGAPVTMDTNYSYSNIFGKLEYENYYGALKTDYTMLQPGLLHKANGGYIVFQANDLLTNSLSYETLKKVLRSKLLGIENAVDQRSSMVMVSLKPEPIPLNLKVILIGDENIYQALLMGDPDFKKLFKIKVEFADITERTPENLTKLAQIIHGYCEQEELLHLDPSGVARMAEYSSKIADDQGKLSTRFGELTKVISEAATWARLDKQPIVTSEYIDKALEERIKRVKKYDEKYIEMIKDNTLLIDTDGYEVGQINGLTIMGMGDYTFGKPARITVNTYAGKSGIVNIEREVELSGSSHSKGVLILNGYLGEMFAQDMPLSLTASICFEQLYNGVDGDSASSTELYALLSSLSKVPINQALAVTGSVNQKGEIQPIGGVNEKIQGFYEICKMRGLDGSHGVIIPEPNIQNLNLSDEIIQAVKDKKFHIYAISDVEEGIELLTGVPAGKKDANGHFPAGTVNYLVYETLKKYAKASKEYN